MSVTLPPDSGDMYPKENIPPGRKRRATDKESEIVQRTVANEPTEKRSRIQQPVAPVEQESRHKRGADNVEEAASVPLKRAGAATGIDPRRAKKICERSAEFGLPVTKDDLQKACQNPAIRAVLTRDLAPFSTPPVDHSPDATGYTALHYALMVNDTKAIQLCLQSGADLHLTIRGENLLLFAERCSQPEAVALILNAAREIERRPIDPSVNSVSQLMQLKDSDWRERGTGALHSKIEQYCTQCVPSGKSKKSAGFLEKKVVEPGSHIAVIGDIHGNGLRLDLTLKALQERGFLDASFHVVPGRQLLFLGDYMDRGQNNLKVLELVLTLKLENPDQVSLIRGNHEDADYIESRLDKNAKADFRYFSYMQRSENLDRMDKLFKRLPVAVYVAQRTEDGNEQYMQFCHGLFHLFTDPAPLLETKDAYAALWVKGVKTFSHRVQLLLQTKAEEGESKKMQKLRASAAKLTELRALRKTRFRDIYWLDAGKTFSHNKESGRFKISPDLVRAYLHVSSTPSHKVKEIMRGHQGGVWSVKGETQKVVVTTLDPSKDENVQCFIEIQTAEKVRKWQRLLVSLPLSSNHQNALGNITVASADSLKEPQ